MKWYRQVDELFYELISKAEEELKNKLSSYSKLYILELLKKLSKNNDIFTNELIKEMAIAEIFMNAFHTNMFERIKMLKLVGDFSLITAGLYPESVEKKLVDIAYYIQMGKSSYKELFNLYSSFPSKKDLMSLYYSLMKDFFKIVEILTELSDQFNLIDKNDIFNLQKKWEKTEINFYKKQISKSKVIPICKDD